MKLLLHSLYVSISTNELWIQLVGFWDNWCWCHAIMGCTVFIISNSYCNSGSVTTIQASAVIINIYAPQILCCDWICKNMSVSFQEYFCQLFVVQHLWIFLCVLAITVEPWSLGVWNLTWEFIYRICIKYPHCLNYKQGTGINQDITLDKDIVKFIIINL